MPRTSTKPAEPVRRQASDYRLEDQVGFLLRRAYQRASSNLVEQIGSYDLTETSGTFLQPQSSTNLSYAPRTVQLGFRLTF